MSFVTIRYLYCDGPLCRGGEPYSNAPNVNEPIEAQRKLARQEGWTCRPHADYCPECVDRMWEYFKAGVQPETEA